MTKINFMIWNIYCFGFNLGQFLPNCLKTMNFEKVTSFKQEDGKMVSDV